MFCVLFFFFCFATLYNGPFNFSKDEVADGKFWKISELKKMSGKGILTPNFEHEAKYLVTNNIIQALAKKPSKLQVLDR